MDDLWMMTSSDKAVVTGWLNFKLLRIWMKVKRLAWWSLNVKIAAECDILDRILDVYFACINCLLHRSCDIFSQEATKGLKFALQLLWRLDLVLHHQSFWVVVTYTKSSFLKHLTRHPVSKLTTVADHTCSGYRGLIQFSHGRSYLAKCRQKIVIVLFSQRKCSNQIPSSPEDGPDESQVAWRRHMIQKY